MFYRIHCISLAVVAMFIASAVTSADELSTDKLTSVLRQYNQTSETRLPVPSDEQLNTIIRGDMVNVRVRTQTDVTHGEPTDKIRVVGYQLVERPRLLVWLATLNPTTQHNKRLAEYLVDISDSGGSIWYQHLDTPWPVRNRHWVISNVKDTEIEQATSGLVWEHNWQLTKHGQDIALNLLKEEKVRGLDQSNFDSAIYLTANRGAWTMFSINDDVTLVAAQTTADMGGWIPDSWVAKFVSRQLSSVLQNLAVKADSVHEDYTGETIVFTGAGVPITVQDAVIAQSRFRHNQDVQTQDDSYD